MNERIVSFVINLDTRWTFSRFTTEESYTCNNVHNTKSTAVRGEVPGRKGM